LEAIPALPAWPLSKRDANAMGGFLVINPRAGDAEPSPEQLRDEAARRGLETHLLSSGEDPAELARATTTEALGMAGGDGSLAAVAAVALERDLPFVVVPFGTRNHFARDLGLDRDEPIAALDAFSGEETRVDIGRVNGRPFLNNVSLGLYARLVNRREGHRRRRAAFARLRALGLLLRSPGSLGVTIDGRPAHARVVLVANNHYKLELLSLGERGRLDAGALHLYVAHGWWPRTWEEEAGTEFTVDARAGRLRAAVDGEPEELETPLRFEIEPRALRVLLPAR
jgi:diacylglycerol kinase family enzyme